MPRDATWHATPVLVRAGLGSAALSVIAVVLARPDLLVLAAPLLGPELVALARQLPPYPRMNLQQIDVLLTRIEAL